MCGIDVHMDPNIGKRLNALGNTLTSLTGEEDADDIADLNSINMADLSDEDEADRMSPTMHMVSHYHQFLKLNNTVATCASKTSLCFECPEFHCTSLKPRANGEPLHT